MESLSHGRSYITRHHDYLMEYPTTLLSDEVLSLVNDLLLTFSTAQVLRDLGYEELFREFLNYVKYYVSEFALILNTGHYINGLASELSKVMKGRIWLSNVDEDMLKELLISTLYLRGELLRKQQSCSDVSGLIRLLSKVFSIDLSSSSTLKYIITRCDAALAVQAVLNSLIIFVGGVAYVYGFKN